MEGNHKEKERLVLKQVPWINKLEFETVYTKLFSKDPIDQRWAVDRISAWTARNPALIALGVDATAGLVRAVIQDYTVQNNISACDFSDITLLYCMAVIRFVNLVAEECQPHDRSLPLCQIARMHGIPEWIIQLRHQATHSSVPHLEKLRLATETCLKWLDENYWTSEIANIIDYCPKFNEEAEIACQAALSNFKKIQYELLFGTENFGKKRDLRLSYNQVVADINASAKTNGKILVQMLAKPEFLLSQTAASQPLLESSDCFIEKEAVTLPKNIEKLWQPVISVLDQKDLLEELILTLLQSQKKLSDENQRMAIAWTWKILYTYAESWGSQMKNDSYLAKALKQNARKFSWFNWLHILDVCLCSYSKYIPAVLPIIAEHIYPPLPAGQKNCLMGLVAIATGALADVDSNEDVSTKVVKVYNVENIKTVLELQEVVDRGETSLYHKEKSWKLYTGDINWAEYPSAYIFSQESDVVGPHDLEINELSKTRNETENTVPDETAAITMKCDEDKNINESTEVPADEEKIKADLELQGDESHITECSADYCAPEDVNVF